MANYSQDNQSQLLKSGALYSVYNGDENGDYSVVKVLVISPPIIHLRFYRNKFETRPTSIDPSMLSLGGFTIEDIRNRRKTGKRLSFGIGHLPLDLTTFVNDSQPIFLMDSSVTEEMNWKATDTGKIMAKTCKNESLSK